MNLKHIKSGPEIVSDFLVSLQKQEGINQSVVAAIRQLFAEGKLNRNRLIRSLDEIRSSTTTEDRVGQTEDETNGG